MVLVPTMGRTDAGFYIGIDPVEVRDSTDRAGAEEAMLRTVERGNPMIPTPTRNNFPDPVVLKYANVKSLSTFEKAAKSWKLSKNDRGYIIAPYRLRRDAGADEDTENEEQISEDVPLREVVHRLVQRALGERGH